MRYSVTLYARQRIKPGSPTHADCCCPLSSVAVCEGRHLSSVAVCEGRRLSSVAVCEGRRLSSVAVCEGRRLSSVAVCEGRRLSSVAVCEGRRLSSVAVCEGRRLSSVAVCEGRRLSSVAVCEGRRPVWLIYPNAFIYNTWNPYTLTLGLVLKFLQRNMSSVGSWNANLPSFLVHRTTLFCRPEPHVSPSSGGLHLPHSPDNHRYLQRYKTTPKLTNPFNNCIFE